MSEIKNTKNIEDTKDKKKVNIRYLLIALVMLIICGILVFLLYMKNYIPEYRDIVNYSMSSKLWNKNDAGEKSLVCFDFNISAVDENLFSFNIVDYNYDDSVKDVYSGVLTNRNMIDITEAIDGLDLSSIEERADNSGGYEYIITFKTRFSGEDPDTTIEQSSIVCYDNIDDSVKSQIVNFYNYLIDYINSDVKDYTFQNQ